MILMRRGMRVLLSALSVLIFAAGHAPAALAEPETDSGLGVTLDLTPILRDMSRLLIDLIKQVYLELIYPVIGAVTGWVAGWRMGKGLEEMGYTSGVANTLVSIVLSVVGAAAMWSIGPALAELLSKPFTP